MSAHPSRLLRELKQSPGKAAVLLLGAVGAAVVWGPRLASGFSSSSSGPQQVTAAPEESSDQSGIVRRDPAGIRTEFIRISTEAKHLRVLAEPTEPRTILLDPFAAKSFVRAPAPPAPGKEAREEEAAEQDERQAAEGLRLQGVVEFKSGRTAVLSGEVLRTGDRVSGLLVESIEPRAVTLRGRFAIYRLEMEKPEENR
ncbi:MAG: hypothetical protein V2A76_11550 [Planctomycetota bacterium]